MEIAADQVLKLDQDRAVWRELGEEVVVLDLQGSTYLTLNRSGGLLWKLLDRGATRSQLAKELGSLYGITDEQAARDVESFVAALDERRLLSLPATSATDQMGGPAPAGG